MSTRTWPSVRRLGLIMPASVEIDDEPVDGTAPILAAKRAKQRIPLPHISGSVPSALYMRMRRSAPGISGGSTNMMPSPPMPNLRSHMRAACSGLIGISPSALSRLSTSMKSLPRP